MGSSKAPALEKTHSLALIERAKSMPVMGNSAGISDSDLAENTEDRK